MEGNDGILLRLPREATPLPEVEPALAFLSVLGALFRRGPAAAKLAALKSLAREGSGPWRIEQLQELLAWLTPSSAVKVVAALRADGILNYQEALHRYVLSPYGRRAMLLIDLLCQPGDERQAIREIDALIARARARGDEFSEILQLLEIAVAQLRDIRNELQELLAIDTREALLEVAERADLYVDHMQALSSHHEDVLGRHRYDADAKPVLDSASALVPEIAALVYEAFERLSDDARELRRFGVRIDRDTVRAHIAKTGLEALAPLIEHVARPLPSIPAIDLGAAAAKLADEQRHRRRPAPLPSAPRALDLVDLGPPLPDEVAILRAQLAALTEPLRLDALIVGEHWTEAVANHARLLTALSELGIAAPKLTAGSPDTIMVGEVWRLTRAAFEPA